MNSNVFACGGLVFITIGFSQRALHCCVLCIYKHTHIYVYTIYIHIYYICTCTEYQYLYLAQHLSPLLFLCPSLAKVREAAAEAEISLCLSLSHTLYFSLSPSSPLSLPPSLLDRAEIFNYSTGSRQQPTLCCCWQTLPTVLLRPKPPPSDPLCLFPPSDPQCPLAPSPDPLCSCLPSSFARELLLSDFLGGPVRDPPNSSLLSISL